MLRIQSNRGNSRSIDFPLHAAVSHFAPPASKRRLRGADGGLARGAGGPAVGARRCAVACAALGYVARAPLSARPVRRSRVAPSMALITGSPFGYFDPLQLSREKTPEEMNQLREYELKHGRVAMAAVFGLIVEPWIHPLAKSCHVAHPTDPILSGVELNFAGKAQILGWIFCVEIASEMGKPHYLKGGDFVNYDWAELSKNMSAETLERKQEAELKNGRLAMIGFMSFLAAANIPGAVPGVPH